jgi:hypothetical protein
MLADELCPECHGRPSVKQTHADRIRKRCRDCGHSWLEEPTAEPLFRLVGRGGWVRLREAT